MWHSGTSSEEVRRGSVQLNLEIVYQPHLVSPEKMQEDKVRYSRTLPNGLKTPLHNICFLDGNNMRRFE